MSAASATRKISNVSAETFAQYTIEDRETAKRRAPAKAARRPKTELAMTNRRPQVATDRAAWASSMATNRAEGTRLQTAAMNRGYPGVRKNQCRIGVGENPLRS